MCTHFLSQAICELGKQGFSRAVTGTVSVQAMGMCSLEVRALHQKRPRGDLAFQEEFSVWLYHSGSGPLMERGQLCVCILQGNLTGMPIGEKVRKPDL